MNAPGIAGLRMRSQRLSSAPLEDAAAVIRWLGAVQAQEHAVAKWTIGLRAKVTDAVLERAFEDGAILRTHVLRPTWHFVLPADIRWMLELTAPRVHGQSAHRYRALELDDVVFARSHALLSKALSGGRQLTRTEAQAVLAAGGIDASGQRLAYIMMHAELECVVCSGSLKGKQHTYALFAERAPGAQSLPRDEALAELTRRYFTSHGPATLNDFARWASLTVADVRRAVGALGRALESMDVDGHTYWFAPGAPPQRRNAPRAYLLQGYDEYVVAYSDSRRVFDIAGVLPSGPTSRPPFTHAIMLDGQIIGHWRRTLKRAALLVEVQLLTKVDRPARVALEEAVARYARFAGAETWEMSA